MATLWCTSRLGEFLCGLFDGHEGNHQDGVAEWDSFGVIPEDGTTKDTDMEITPCELAGDHLPRQDHRWQECPVYHDED